MATKPEDILKLAESEMDAVTNESIAARDEEIQRGIDNQNELNALTESQKAEADALGAYNKAQYENVGQIVGDIQGKIDAAKAKDATAQKREKAYRYISGLGDTISSLANLVGTAHGASNQNQTYNSHAVVQKAEEARKARKLEMDDLSKRLDEMKARQRDMQAAGSLKEAELKARQDKDTAQLLATQRQAELEAKRYAQSREDAASQRARDDWENNRRFEAQQDQWNKTYNMQYAKFLEEQKGKDYNFTLANETIDIPKEKLNDVNVERIFNMLPKEIRESIKGEQYTEIIPGEDEFADPIKKTSYKAPSLAQKLAAIGAYADSNANIKNELKRLAGKEVITETTETTPTKTQESKPTTQTRNYGTNVTGTKSYNPNAMLGKENAMNYFNKYMRKQ